MTQESQAEVAKERPADKEGQVAVRCSPLTMEQAEIIGAKEKRTVVLREDQLERACQLVGGLATIAQRRHGYKILFRMALVAGDLKLVSDALKESRADEIEQRRLEIDEREQAFRHQMTLRRQVFAEKNADRPQQHNHYLNTTPPPYQQIRPVNQRGLEEVRREMEHGSVQPTVPGLPAPNEELAPLSVRVDEPEVVTAH